MTDNELWLRVGQRLAVARKMRGFDKYQQYIRVHHQPATATIQSIEAGRPGNVTSLSNYATALGLSLPNILLEILSAAETTTLPAEIQAVVDALQLNDPALPMLPSWQEHTKAAAQIVLRQSKRTPQASGGQSSELSGGGTGRRKAGATRGK